MAVMGIGGASALTLQSISDMRNKLDDLQRQLGSGQKTTSYAGLGLDAGLTVGLRTQLSARGRARAALFPWRRTAQETWTVYEEVASLPPRRSSFFRPRGNPARPC